MSPALADIRITVSDVRAAGFCAGPKTWKWFTDHGFDFRAFIRQGLSADEFLAGGDAQAEQVFRRKLAREGLSDPRREPGGG